MKAFLMYRDRDFDPDQLLADEYRNWRSEPQRQVPAHEAALREDLEVNTLFNAMALGDEFLFKVAQKAILSNLNTDLETISYRQAILKDCLRNPSVVRAIYAVPLELIENRRRRWLGIFGSSPSSILDSAVNMLVFFVELLKKLRNIAVEHADKFESDGFTRFFAMIRKELDDEYFAVLENHLKELKFDRGVLISTELGKGNEATSYVLRLRNRPNGNWMKRVFTPRSPVYRFSLHPRDEAGAIALANLRAQGINLVANAVAQSADHINSFLNMLRVELAFYIGCLNLYEQLAKMGEPIAFPSAFPAEERKHSFIGLYDVCLALTKKDKVVGNDVNADSKNLVIITGANQGGKSTFLRSIGLAQLMMQCGMFVPAESFTANLCNNIFTHYKREEDVTMKSGKFDEELSRMSDVVDHLTPNSMLLFNESFAATNEREGSEIARQIVSALLEKHIKVFYVTHLYQFAHGFSDKRKDSAMFLRAERQPDGTRTFKLIEGEPLETSYGEDLYQRIFG